MDICKSITVQTLMERVEVINMCASVSGWSIGAGVVLPSVKGVEVELDEVEVVYHHPISKPAGHVVACAREVVPA